MSKQPEEQSIRSRARRRLIGAVALSLAVVVVLPMVLDREPKVNGQDIDLRIPAPDKVADFAPQAVAEIVAQSEVVTASDVVAVSDVPAVASVPTASVTGKIVQPAPRIEPPVEKLSVPQKPVEVHAADIKKIDANPPEIKKPDVKAPEIKKPEVKTPEVKKVEAKAAEAKKPDAKTDAKKSETKTEDKSSGSYIVQVGAFSNADAAAGEADKLKGWGFKAYTEQIGSTMRVRVGPYTDRARADTVRALLEKHGRHPVIAAVK